MGYAEPGAVWQEGVGWSGGHGCDSASQEDKIGPVAQKNVRNDDRDSKGLRFWHSVNNNRTEDDANDNNVGERGVTAADDVDDFGNGKEDRVEK